MRIDPNMIILQSKEDIIDYITMGIVPCRSDAYEVFMELRSPGTSLIQLNYDRSHSEGIELAEIMERVYENVRANQRIAAIGMGVTGALGFILGRRFR